MVLQDNIEEVENDIWCMKSGILFERKKKNMQTSKKGNAP